MWCVNGVLGFTSTEITHRVHEAKGVAKKAGLLAQTHFQNLDRLEIEHKGLQDFVSEADRSVEALIRDELLSRFPGDRFIGEEGGVSRREGDEPVWVVDPIDGTTNFLRGIPRYAVSIGLVAEGQIQGGIIYDPTHDELFCASLESSATCNDKPIGVRPTQALEAALVGVGFCQKLPKDAFTQSLRALIETGAEFRRQGSAALGLAQVASGRFDAFWQMHLSPWDVIAGLLIVQRAGGLINHFLDGDGLYSGNPVLATTPALGPRLEKCLNMKLMAPRARA